jgi:predicted CXXCH cytochrome family protein
MTIVPGRCVVVAGTVALVLASAGGAAAGQPRPAAEAQSGCVACHTTLADPRYSSPVVAFRDDIHAARGFGCVDCHGGDASATDKAAAKDPARGYRGRPQGPDIITVCARCHSDAELMRRFAPRQRVDQASEFAVSVHGKRLQEGDTRVATCVSCHSIHDIRQVSDAKSPVFPTNVAATCARCHADPAHMAPYKGLDGSPLPTDQRANYEKSVHYTALVKQNDLAAPTCNDCHGNHGAAPPGVGAVTNVCGTCHAIFATKFEPSSHGQIFERGCVECHSNHAILQPSDELLGTSGAALCITCHSEGDNGYKAADAMRTGIERVKSALGRTDSLISTVRNEGMEVSEQELGLAEARAKLTLARTEIHSFDPAALNPILEEGLAILSRVEQAGEQAQAELRFRRRGLAASLAAILLVVIGLAWKVREIDRRQRL